jgi:hypothetical protein
MAALDIRTKTYASCVIFFFSSYYHINTQIWT